MVRRRPRERVMHRTHLKKPLQKPHIVTSNGVAAEKVDSSTAC
jgi:hypothetical protein